LNDKIKLDTSAEDVRDITKEDPYAVRKGA